MFKKALLNIAIELGPIIGFLVLVESIDFIVATGWFVAFTALSLALAFYKRRTLALFPLIVAVSVIIFGALTLYFHDPFFFIFKDTVYNLTFGAAIFIFLARDIILLKVFFQEVFAISDTGWVILSKRWGILFLLLAFSNECTRGFLTPEQWALYKLVATGITTIFGVYQFTLTKKYRLPEASPWGLRQ
ncbi:MAG: septation protein IspZ [Candidatus Moranbacteria bacterium]|nr:septation protein IspZ [Candidatus Moranbacteria bacterium]